MFHQHTASDDTDDGQEQDTDDDCFKKTNSKPLLFHPFFRRDLFLFLRNIIFSVIHELHPPLPTLMIITKMLF